MAIYAFARTADDIVDEGDASPAERAAGLGRLERALTHCAETAGLDDPMLVAVADVRHRFDLPAQPFLDLLSAFRQDITQRRYCDFGELMGYCRRSANPIGRLLLRLYRADTPTNVGRADAICSALQLINFLQDIRDDLLQRDRIYLPQDELQRYGVSEIDIAEGRNTPGLTRLIAFQCQRAQRLLRSGAPLGRALPGRAGLELRMIVLGGERIVEGKRLRARNAPFERPVLGTADRLGMLLGALGKF